MIMEKKLKLIRFKIYKKLREIYYKEILDKKFRFNNKKINEVDPVTYLDLKFENTIKKIIREFFIDHNIVGEEFGSEILDSDYTWYIDPIDGTKSFLMGLPNWASLIGLYYKSSPIFSMAYFPVLDKLYFTDKKNSYLKSNNNIIRIRSSKNTDIKKTKIAINTFKAISNIKNFRKLKKLNNFYKITGADSLNFCLVSEGKIDLLIEKGLKKIDYIPLMHLLKNSGAIITDWKKKNQFSKGDVIVASNKKVYQYFHKKLIQ